MTRVLKCVRIALAVAIGAGCLVLDDNPFIPSASLISDADARVGRPLTPMSYAGVARRTTRRAVAAGAAVGAATVYAPSCYQVVDAYGQLYWYCP